MFLPGCYLLSTAFFLTWHIVVASFPGQPHSFCSSVCVDNNTRMRKSGDTSRRTGKNGVGLGTRLIVCMVELDSLKQLTSVYYCMLLSTYRLYEMFYHSSHDTMLNPVYIPPDALEEVDSGVKIEDDEEITVNKNALDSED